MAFSYKRTITVDRTKVPNTDQTNFAVLVSFTNATFATVANGGRVTSANGYDICFYSDSALTTKLDHEIERYNATTGEVIMWVRIPTLTTAADYVFYVGYGDATIITSQENKTGTWNSAYKSVWHLPDGTTLTALESTTNANDGTISGAIAGTGKVDGSASFSGTAADKITAASTTANTFAGDFTVSVWVNWTSSALAYQSFVGSNNTFITNASFLRVWGTGAPDPTLRSKVGIGNPTHDGSSAVFSNTSLSSGVWTYVTAARATNVITLYLNGLADKVGAADSSTYDFSQGGTCIGLSLWDGADGYFKGLLDEIRFSNVARSADWILTEFNNQSDPATFFTLGAETVIDAGNLMLLGVG
jgi:hypothetical protein